MLSIVIPIFNEQGNIRPLIRRLKNVLHSMNSRFEIILVNDGSHDKSLKILLEEKRKYKELVIISFSRNHGQTVAMQRGITQACGDIIVTMDADLQNLPEDIPRLIKGLNRYDVVCGWRYKRKDKFFSKSLPSRFSNLLVRVIADSRIHDAGCSLRAYRKTTIENLNMFGEMHRFIPIILQKQGFRVTELKVRHRRRHTGSSNYGMERYLRGLLDFMFVLFLSKYSRRPLHLFGLIGIMTFTSGCFLLITDLIYLFLIIQRPLSSINVGPLIFISLLLIFFGINFIILGIMSEMMFLSVNRETRERVFR